MSAIIPRGVCFPGRMPLLEAQTACQMADNAIREPLQGSPRRTRHKIRAGSLRLPGEAGGST